VSGTGIFIGQRSRKGLLVSRGLFESSRHKQVRKYIATVKRNSAIFQINMRRHEFHFFFSSRGALLYLLRITAFGSSTKQVFLKD